MEREYKLDKKEAAKLFGGMRCPDDCPFKTGGFVRSDTKGEPKVVCFERSCQMEIDLDSVKIVYNTKE